MRREKHEPFYPLFTTYGRIHSQRKHQKNVSM